MKIPLLGPKPQTRMPDYDQNMFWSGEQRGNGATESVDGTPGLRRFAASGVMGEYRGGKVVNDAFYCVFGNAVFVASTLGICTRLGTLGTSTGKCFVEYNPTQLMIVDGKQRMRSYFRDFLFCGLHNQVSQRKKRTFGYGGI